MTAIAAAVSTYGTQLSARIDSVDQDAAHRAQLRREERRAPLEFDRNPFARLEQVWED